MTTEVTSAPTDAASTAPGVPVPTTRKEQALWMLERVAPDVAVNNVPGAVVHVDGTLDAGLLRSAVTALLRRHQVLRTVFAVEQDRLVKWVAQTDAVASGVVHTESGRWSDDELDALLREFVVRPFALDGGPLLRVGYFERDGRSTLALAVHHLVFDGMSSTVFLQELAVVYGLAAAGRDLTRVRVDEVPAWAEPAASAAGLAFWRQHLHGFDPSACELAMAEPGTAVDSVAGAYLSRRLSPAAAQVLRDAPRTLHAPDAVTLLAAFFLLLRRHGAGRDLTVGLPVNIRTAQTARAIGYHVNILPVRTDLDPDLPVGEFVRSTRDLFLEAAGHADTPVDEVLVDAPRRSASWRSSLFRHVFNFMPGSPDVAYEIGGRPARVEVLETGTSKFDLEFVLAADPGGYRLKVTYTTAMHSRRQVEALMERFDALVVGLGADPSQPIGRLEALTPADRVALAAAGERSLVVADAEGRALPPGVSGAVQHDGTATGDLGRLRADGSLEVLGRLERRVRRQGEPVQLEHVEAVLGQVAGVTGVHAVPGPDPDDERLLVVVDGTAEPHAVHAAARDTLPAAARPDRVAIAATDDDGSWASWWERATTDAQDTPDADDATSALLVGMYRDALGAGKDLDANSNFFMSGGQSLMAAQLVQRIQREIGVTLRLSDVFEDPTPAGLARRVVAVRDRATRRFVRAETMHGLFDWCVEQQPDTVAVRQGARRLTYGELAAASLDYAAELERAGVGPGDTVPVLLARSPELIAVLLAVVRRGAAYAAFDPRWPQRRIDELTLRLAPRLLVTDRPGARPVPVWAPPRAEDAARRADTPTPVEVGPDDASAVFFTSGTTGTPKGVVTAHRGIVRLFDDYAFAPIGSGAVMAQGMAATWDAFALDSWAVLLTGGTAVLAADTLDIARRLREYRAGGVDRIFLPTAVFHMLVDTDLAGFDGLAVVGTGGEKLSSAHARRFLAAYPDIPLHNMYGPVESTIAATDHIVRPQDVVDDLGVPLGSALPHTGVHVLDGDRPCEAGERGEICLTGEGLALGYLGDPDLMAARFVELSVVPGEPAVRVYRTGDLGHRSADGLLHYDGRTDSQVKMRGYRIELADVERNASDVAGVGSCVVVPIRDDAGACTDLALFYTVRDDSGPQEHQVRAALADRLPDYLVPKTIRHLESLPVLEDRKIDHAALARQADELSRPTGVSADDAPTGAVEHDLAECFEKVLRVGPVTRSASFFDLGGNSVRAAQLLAEVDKRFGVRLAMGQVFDAPSIAQLAALLA